jgi:cell division protein FtsW
MSRDAAAIATPITPALGARALSTGWEAPALLLLTVALLSFGLVSVYSASAVMAQSKGVADYYFLVRQMTAAAIGLVALAIAAQVDYRRLRIMAWPILLFAIALLVIVILPGTEAIAPNIKGARRWLNFGPAQIQPSEVAKLALIIWTAALAVKKQEKLPSLSRGLLPFLAIWGLVLLLIFMEPNLSAACLVLLLSALVAFAGGARIGHFILLGLIGLPILWAQVDSVAYRMKRIAAFLDPAHDPAGVSYQINQAMIAIGSGGLWGRGFGHGLQKFGYLPEPHNDFILAMIGEEWGFVGVVAIIVAFAAFALIGYRIARNAEDMFGFLLAVGLTNLIVVQGLLHIAVNMAVIPTTGFTLPFVSYGGSSVLICLTAVGTLVSVARRSAAGAR